jgi:hypothetical protein
MDWFFVDFAVLAGCTGHNKVISDTLNLAQSDMPHL